jgi:hypothetical protein
LAGSVIVSTIAIAMRRPSPYRQRYSFGPDGVMTDMDAIDAIAEGIQRKVVATQRLAKFVGIAIMIVVGLATFILLPDDGKIGEYKFLIACGAGLASFAVCMAIARARLMALVREFERTTGFKL